MISAADAMGIGVRIANMRDAYDRGDLRSVRALAQELLAYLSNVAETVSDDDDLIRSLVDLGSAAAELIVVTEGRDAL